MSKQNIDKSSWAVAGGVLMGLGAGFFYLNESALYFVGCIIAGLGLGLMVSAVLSQLNGRH